MNKETQCIISESRLKELLIAECELEYLEETGVDNWSWYGEGRGSYIKKICEEINLPYEEDMDISDLVEYEIKNYEKV